MHNTARDTFPAHISCSWKSHVHLFTHLLHISYACVDSSNAFRPSVPGLLINSVSQIRSCLHWIRCLIINLRFQLCILLVVWLPGQRHTEEQIHYVRVSKSVYHIWTMGVWNCVYIYAMRLSVYWFTKRQVGYRQFLTRLLINTELTWKYYREVNTMLVLSRQRCANWT